ncbi:MAG TPA: methyltransferase domain-containing protein, partial [Phycisphaerae bacterium]|nr:methyltransferase domain-containing protein [Phycisphaerae bacterium]
QGYTVTGADASPEMLDLARRHAERAGAKSRFICCRYGELAQQLGAGFDGVFCIGNSLAAACSADAGEEAVANFGAVLRPGGRLFVQVLNFVPMREESPCVRGPRLTVVDGVEHVSVRCFQFMPKPEAGPQGHIVVTNVTLWNDGAWHQRSHGGTIYPLTRDELAAWCGRADLTVVDTYGAYDRSAFDAQASVDLIIVAQRNA